MAGFGCLSSAGLGEGEREEGGWGCVITWWSISKVGLVCGGGIWMAMMVRYPRGYGELAVVEGAEATYSSKQLTDQRSEDLRSNMNGGG